MLKVGREEIDAIAKVLESGEIFRYHEGGYCERMERRLEKELGVGHAILCSSGTAGLTAALAGLRLGPGDEVIVPGHTFMASASAVVGVGAIPVIVDIDESITIDPEAIDTAVGPRTRAVIPVHMWGAVCDMDRILDVARRHGLKVIEDACQCIGGSYKGRPLGTLGDVGVYSYNYYKNVTAGEGGCVVTGDDDVYQRVRCMIDACHFYWQGREAGFTPFISSGTRVSEIQGAMLHAQYDRLPGLIESLRRTKARILDATADTGLTPSPRHCPEGECATTLMYLLPTPGDAEAFAQKAGGGILAKTGRHTYTEWDAILQREGAHHPALNPFTMAENAECRMNYSKDMLPHTLDILSRTVSIGLNPEATDEEIDRQIAAIREAAAGVSK